MTPIDTDVVSVTDVMDQLTDAVQAIAHHPSTTAGHEQLWHSSLRLCEALLTLSSRLVINVAAGADTPPTEPDSVLAVDEAARRRGGRLPPSLPPSVLLRRSHAGPGRPR